MPPPGVESPELPGASHQTADDPLPAWPLEPPASIAAAAPTEAGALQYAIQAGGSFGAGWHDIVGPEGTRLAVAPSTGWQQVDQDGRSLEELRRELDSERGRECISVQTQTDDLGGEPSEDCYERWFGGFELPLAAGMVEESGDAKAAGRGSSGSSSPSGGGDRGEGER